MQDYCLVSCIYFSGKYGAIKQFSRGNNRCLPAIILNPLEIFAGKLITKRKKDCFGRELDGTLSPLLPDRGAK